MKEYQKWALESDIHWILLSLLESNECLLKGRSLSWVSKTRSMYFAHKKIRRFHTGQSFIYLLKSLHWRATGVEPNVMELCIVLCLARVYIVNIDRQTPAFFMKVSHSSLDWLVIMHECVIQRYRTWTRSGKPADFAYRLLHVLRLDQNKIFTFLLLIRS